jgi:hypothetical protein
MTAWWSPANRAVWAMIGGTPGAGDIISRQALTQWSRYTVVLGHRLLSRSVRSWMRQAVGNAWCMASSAGVGVDRSGSGRRIGTSSAGSVRQLVGSCILATSPHSDAASTSARMSLPGPLRQLSIRHCLTTAHGGRPMSSRLVKSAPLLNWVPSPVLTSMTRSMRGNRRVASPSSPRS